MSEAPIETGEVHWSDLGVTVRWEAYSHRLEFKAREGTAQPDGSTVYMYFTEAGSPEYPRDFALAERYIDGSIKWDGCSHLYFGDEEGYIHLCGAGSFQSLRETLSRVFQIAREKVPHWYEPDFPAASSSSEGEPR